MAHKTDPIECNLPFRQVPRCQCDDGMKDAPTLEDMAMCRSAGGPCSEMDDLVWQRIKSGSARR